MSSDDAPPHASNSETPAETSLRFGMVLAEVWRDWFETMAQVADQTHRACEFFAANGGASNWQYGPSDFFTLRGPFEGANGSIDMEKLRQSLQSMEPMQAAKVMHAVQVMQAMETMLTRKRSRTNEPQGAAW